MTFTEWLRTYHRELEARTVITVTISINERVIFARSAVRVAEGAVNTYQVDDGRRLTHRYQDGAIPLAIQLLEGIVEPGTVEDTL